MGIPAIASLLLALWVVACLWFPLTDTDIWWHLAAAKWMAANGAVPRTDPFSITAAGKPWVDLHWGFQLLAYGLWSLGGAAALVAAKVAAVGASLLIVLKSSLRRDNAWFLIPFAALGIHAVRFHLDMRPLVVTLLGLSVLHLATLAHLEGRLQRPWLVLIPVQIVLANLQGLYPLGALLVTCLWAGAWWDRRGKPGADLRVLGLSCVGLWLAGLLTPYGWRGFALPLALLGRITPTPGNVFSSEIAENRPLHALAAEHPSAALPFLLLAAAVGWTFFAAGRHRSLGHLLLVLGFGALGLMAQRNLPLFFLAGLMAAGRNLQVSPMARPAFHPWVSVAGVLFLAGFHGPRIREAWRYELPGSLETPFRFPRAAAEFLAAHPLPGNLFNELRFGGYLAFRLHPERKVFVDGRMILREAGFYAEFLDVVDRPQGFPAYAARHGLTHALLPIGEDARFRPLAAWIHGRMGWRLLYGDGAAVLLADSSALTEPAHLPAGMHSAELLAQPSLKARFGANPRLETIARRNLEEFRSLAEYYRAMP